MALGRLWEDRENGGGKAVDNAGRAAKRARFSQTYLKRGEPTLDNSQRAPRRVASLNASFQADQWALSYAVPRELGVDAGWGSAQADWVSGISGAMS